RALDELARRHRLGFPNLVGEVEAADQALGAVYGVVGVGDDVALGAVADEHRAVLEKADDARVRALAPFVRDHGGLGVFDDGDAAVAGPQVDADSDVVGFGHKWRESTVAPRGVKDRPIGVRSRGALRSYKTDI